MTYLTNSLFDYRSPENNGVRAEFILDAATHKVSQWTGLWTFPHFLQNLTPSQAGHGEKVTAIPTELLRLATASLAGTPSSSTRYL